MVNNSTLNNELISTFAKMEEKQNFWTGINSNKSLPTCTCSEIQFCNNASDMKYIFLDPPLEYQDKPFEVLVENFAANFISKLLYEVFKRTCKVTWSGSLDRQSFNIPLWKNSFHWHDLKLYLTPDLLTHEKYSAPENSLIQLNKRKIENEEYTKPNISHVIITAKPISDMYNVPFDSDIYAIPLDVIKNVSHSQNQIKHLNFSGKNYHSSNSFFGPCIFSGNSSINTNSNRSTQLYDNDSLESDIVRNRYSATTCTVPEAVHITMEEVRDYLKTLYPTSYPLIESRNFAHTMKLLKNPFKSIYNNIPNVNRLNTLNNRKTYIFADKKKKMKNSMSNFMPGSQKLNSNDKLKNRSTCRRDLPNSFKQIFCNIFRVKKFPFSHHDFCRGGSDVCNDETAVRLSKEKDENYSNLKVKPPFSKRALPPLPRHQDGHKDIFKKSSFAPLPPPPPSPSLTFKSKRTSNSVDFATSIEKVKNYGWYWGPISGEAAEKILTNEPDGSFIVRDSSDDYYIFSLTFKLNSIIRHVRIEHDQGNFSFGNSTRFKSHTIVDFIESAVEHSRSGRYLFFLHRRPILGPMRVQLLHPVSRFKQVQSLQHLSRFVILKLVRKDLISSLPLPKRLLNYLSTQHYYSENLTDEDRIEFSEKDNVEQFIKLDADGFS